VRSLLVESGDGDVMTGRDLMALIPLLFYIQSECMKNVTAARTNLLKPVQECWEKLKRP
jgi:hypothetical protein